ncbi:hypothetical protein AB6A40_001715 [Gnathostoma spinigerum]|uniref:RRM domain-containing protein n=1 Tax=Gnathostoma spinigerum TaxID=75299 RepID=A0ABD6E630_9BILA
MSNSDSDREKSRSMSPKSDRDSRDGSPSDRKRSRSRSADHLTSSFTRLHVCNFDESIKKGDLEEAFSRYGSLDSVWIASYPPLFAFITFKSKNDASDALKQLDNSYIGKNRIKVAQAYPPRRQGDRGARRYSGSRYSGGGGRYPQRSYGRGGGYSGSYGGGSRFSSGYGGSGDRYYGGSSGGRESGSTRSSRY